MQCTKAVSEPRVPARNTGCGTATTFSSRASGGVPFQRGDLTSQIAANSVEQNFQLLNARLQVNSSWGIITALAFGLAITAICYATAHLSGGQVNDNNRRR